MGPQFGVDIGSITDEEKIMLIDSFGIDFDSLEFGDKVVALVALRKMNSKAGDKSTARRDLWNLSLGAGKKE